MVINLGTNDYGYGVAGDELYHDYIGLIKGVRAAWPEADIIIMVGGHQIPPILASALIIMLLISLYGESSIRQPIPLSRNHILRKSYIPCTSISKRWKITGCISLTPQASCKIMIYAPLTITRQISGISKLRPSCCNM